jgi:2-oxo-4-hydroxy-4-carboxy-5-ureidoimidazoline decarboxylase
MPSDLAAASVVDPATLGEFNQLDAPGAIAVLRGFCGSSRWAAAVETGRPYPTPGAVIDASDRAFDGLASGDWLEAFAAHARVGQPAASDARGAAEQASAATASPAERAALEAGNAAYEARFGHVFLICASGLDAAAVLGSLERRIGNSPEMELGLAAAEQRRITALRIRGSLAS